MLVGIYNNYLSQYGSNEITKYDTHKKSELRSLYNTIVKKAKTSGLYKVDLNEDLQKYVVDLKESARVLKNTAEEFSASSDNLSGFLKKVAYSDDESIASVNVIDSDNIPKDVKDVELDVHALATPQVNLGNFFSNRTQKIAPGDYAFDLSIGGFNYEFQYHVSQDETPSQLQEKLVRLFNKADIGIKATIAVDQAERTAIKLESEATGSIDDKAIFTLSDVENPALAGTMNYFGLDKIYNSPGNAHFSINGEENYSASNNFTINSVYDVSIKETTENSGPVTIGFKNDAEAIMDNIQVLLDKFNSMVSLTKADDNVVSDGRKLEHEINAIARRNRDVLESNGIIVDENSYVSLDKALFTQTVNEGRLSESLEALNNFKNDLGRKATQISLDPMEYVKKTLVTYPNPHNTINRNPYMTSIYTGMMYNNYI